MVPESKENKKEFPSDTIPRGFMGLFAFFRFRTKFFVPLDLLILLSAIACIGFLTLYSAAGCHVLPWSLKHMLRFGVGLGLLWVVSAIDVRFWLSQSFVIYGGCLALLLIVELLGFVGMGAKRWVDLYLFQIQPSELMKIALVLALAAAFHNLDEVDEGSPRLVHLIFPSILILAPALFVLRQPDLGTAMILLMTGAMLFYAAGVQLRIFVTTGLVIAGACPLLWDRLKDYQKKRILVFLDPEADRLGAGYHIFQSKIAIGSGGIWGKGFNQGTQSGLDFLPEKQTDFIFTMLCEEWGLMGGVVVVALYIVLLLKCYAIACEARYIFNRLVVMGVACILFLHVFVNIGMVMGVLPVVGVPLPLMSYGGTSMLTLMIGFGLVVGAHYQKDVRLSSTF